MREPPPTDETAANGGSSAREQRKQLKPEEPRSRLDGSRLAEVAQILRVEPATHAAHRARIAKDADIVARIQLEASIGDKRQKTWEALERDLYRYGWSVLPVMVRDGRLLTVARRVLGVHAADLELIPDVTEEDACDLASEAMSRALPAFKEDILQGRWVSSDDAASLRTFFVGKCAPPFVTAWRRYRRQRCSEKRLASALRQEFHVHNGDLRDVAGQVVDRALQDQALAKIGDMTDRKILVLDAYDLSDPEIAEKLGLTTKAVEYRLSKTRATMRTFFRGAGDEVA